MILFSVSNALTHAIDLAQVQTWYSQERISKNKPWTKKYTAIIAEVRPYLDVLRHHINVETISSSMMQI